MTEIPEIPYTPGAPLAAPPSEPFRLELNDEDHVSEAQLVSASQLYEIGLDLTNRAPMVRWPKRTKGLATITYEWLGSWRIYEVRADGWAREVKGSRKDAWEAPSGSLDVGRAGLVTNARRLYVNVWAIRSSYKAPWLPRKTSPETDRWVRDDLVRAPRCWASAAGSALAPSFPRDEGARAKSRLAGVRAKINRTNITGPARRTDVSIHSLKGDNP
jgi:hypothetical protein